VSSHLSDLRRAGFVTERKSGKWVHYHLVDAGPLSDLVRQALRLVDEDDRLGQDAQAVGVLRKIPLATFCRTGFDWKATGAPPRLAAKRPRSRPSTTRRHA
jgi:hypothetical protein